MSNHRVVDHDDGPTCWCHYVASINPKLINEPAEQWAPLTSTQQPPPDPHDQYCTWRKTNAGWMYCIYHNTYLQETS